RWPGTRRRADDALGLQCGVVPRGLGRLHRALLAARSHSLRQARRHQTHTAATYGLLLFRRAGRGLPSALWHPRPGLPKRAGRGAMSNLILTIVVCGVVVLALVVDVAALLSWLRAKRM